MRLLIDMNLAPRWVPSLVLTGHDAVHWSTLGPIDAADSTICKYARDHDFVLITNDLDSPRILAHTLQSRPGASVEIAGERLQCPACVAIKLSRAPNTRQ